MTAETSSPWRGVAAVAAAYVFFLLYAQFAFLKLLELRFGSGAGVQAAMAAMGLCGLAASLASGALLGRIAPRRLLLAGFAGCAATALVALAVTAPAGLTVVAAAIGAATAVTTVSLAAGLRELVPGKRFGLWVGAGTGLAYFTCNLPPLFEGSPLVQSLAVAAACVLGLAAVALTPARASSRAPASADRLATETAGLGFATVLLSFLALIWLDSAAFAVIQETLALKGQTWASSGQKLIQGGVHALAAVAAGWLLDRGVLRGLLLSTFVLFAVAFLSLGDGSASPWWAGPVYAVGISCYSVALVVVAASVVGAGARLPRRWRAALLFGIAGWIGSALGVGMAQDIHRIPPLFLAVSGLLIVTGWVLAPGGRWRGRVRAGLRTHATTVAFGVAAALVVTHLPRAAGPAATAAERGRRVYVREGCIHCHSQYVRPQSPDVEIWGPYRPPDPAASPPLYGNRRQGPDLANAGVRRSVAWHRLHLLDPRSLAAGSRMPSYAYLFSEGTRGEDLVVYLAGLGREAAGEWTVATREAPSGEVLAEGSAERGARLFRRDCAPCHGPDGRGDGPLAGALFRPAPPRPAMNLRKGPLWLVSWGPGAPLLEASLAQLVRYGVPGTSMPGHETYTPREIADLVAWVEELVASPIAMEEPEENDDGWP